jgi:hypothetical protein
MPLSRVTTTCLRGQQAPNPLLLSLIFSSSPAACSPRRHFSELSPQRAAAAVAEARKPDAAAPPASAAAHARPRRGSGSSVRVFDFQSPRPDRTEASPQRAQQPQPNSYQLARDSQRQWARDQRSHTTGRPNAAAEGMLDGMLESIFPPSSTLPPKPSVSTMFPPTTPRPKLDFAARWAAEVKALDRDLSLAPSDAYTTRVRSSLGSNAITMALRRVKRLVVESEVRKKLFSERSHERPGLKRKRLKMVRWRKRFAADFKKICTRANKLAAQGW